MINLTEIQLRELLVSETIVYITRHIQIVGICLAGFVVSIITICTNTADKKRANTIWDSV